MLAGVRQAPAFSERYDLVCATLGVDVQQALAEQPDTFLHRNEVSSLLTVLASSLSYDLWREEHGPPQWLAGYSVGQWSALYAAGMLDFAALVATVYHRAQLMNACTARQPGGMIGVIGLGEPAIHNVIQQLQTEGYFVAISNYNCVGQYSLAVAADAQEPALQALQQLQPRKLLALPVAGPWHSQLLAEAEAPFAAWLEQTVQQLPQIPVADNVTGQLLPENLPALRRQLARQITAPVRWQQGIETLIRLGCKQFVEIGYGNMLTKFGFFIDRSCRHTAFYTSSTLT
jgi:[acyl-carrier-protein] S-malonyltransferase